ncbi:MAG: hypothetical protein LBJ67_17310 [Planctomycetaceae bacterium]|jgi:hypothetical protein|nr:hypothetical protein [Planctomycetaceae bacterium]
MSETQETIILPDNGVGNHIGGDSCSGNTCVTTQPFVLTPKTYYHILLRHWYHKYCWVLFLNPLLFLFLCGVAAWCCFYGKTDIFYFVLKITACYVLFILFYHGFSHWRLRRAAYHPANKSIMRRVIYTLSRESFTVREIPEDSQEEENIVTRKATDLFQVAVCQQYYLLFLTPYFFCYLPKNAFQKESDRELFEQEILSKYPLAKSNIGKNLVYGFLLFILCGILGVAGGILLSL